MNIFSRNKVSLILVIALVPGLYCNFFNKKTNSTALKVAPDAKFDQVMDNKNKLSEDPYEKMGELNIKVAQMISTTNDNSPTCDSATNVFPVRLTISSGNKIKSFDNYISEDYLFKTLEKRSYDCESIKLYFSLDHGVTNDYLNLLIAKIDKLEVTQVYRPAILHSPPLLSYL